MERVLLLAFRELIKQLFVLRQTFAAAEHDSFSGSKLDLNPSLFPKP